MPEMEALLLFRVFDGLKALLRRENEKKIFYTDPKFQVGSETQSTVKEKDFLRKFYFHS